LKKLRPQVFDFAGVFGYPHKPNFFNEFRHLLAIHRRSRSRPPFFLKLKKKIHEIMGPDESGNSWSPAGFLERSFNKLILPRGDAGNQSAD